MSVARGFSAVFDVTIVGRFLSDSHFRTGDQQICVSFHYTKLSGPTNVNHQSGPQARSQQKMGNSKHPHEATASWDAHANQDSSVENDTESSLRHGRKLKSRYSFSESLEHLRWRKEEDFIANEEEESEALQDKFERKHRKNMKRVKKDPGTRYAKEHGIMIDAGSSGSRLHVYEFEPRILSNTKDVRDAVSGKKITFPYARSRWTDRLGPGVDSFAGLPDDELEAALKEYLAPLIEFAKTVLQDKQRTLHKYPIYFRATAGMRILEQNDRSRVLDTVRSLFSDKKFCPFMFEDEFARVLSGEEEAIFGWAGINFAMGTLVKESEGTGTVVNPKLTYGSLDLGGASTQIAFYEPHEDIMANLFKLQIGQSKHWNVYAHSFLYFGMNEARRRFQAKLASHADAKTQLIEGVQNPCLPGGSKQEVRLKIHFDERGRETFKFDPSESTDGHYQTVLKNDHDTSDFEECMSYTKELLYLDSNTWCQFAHKGQCAFNGVFMPDLPAQSKNFGEFLGFSNIYHVWEELNLPKRASIQELYDGTKFICNMSRHDAVVYSRKIGVKIETIEDLCFRSAYAYNLLAHGYGFENDDYITATDVIGGLKVGWSLGAMLYEINTLPWKIDDSDPNFFVATREFVATSETKNSTSGSTMLTIVVALIGLAIILTRKRQNERKQYEPLKVNAQSYPTYS